MSDRALDIAIQARLASDMDGAVLSVRRLLEAEAAAPSLTVEREMLRGIVEGIDLSVADDNDSDPLYDHLSKELTDRLDAARDYLAALTPSPEEPA